MPLPPAPTPNELQVAARIVPAVDLATPQASGDALEVPVMVELTPPAGSSRTPCDFCCVVDTSGSMNAEAVVQNETGDTETHGVTVLDIVKHGIRTIIRNLGPEDRLSVISYANEASIVVGLQDMTDNNKNEAERLLDSLTPSGMTNLWDGLKKGVEELKSKAEGNRMQHIMLFTDGLPNINPPRGILTMVKRLKDQNGGSLPCTISTFGFGYELDSELLLQLGIQGSGSYAFIPDAGFVGTVFVNAMSNLLVTMAKDTTVTLEATNGARFAEKPILGGYPCTKKDDSTVSVSFGSVQFGQAKHLVAKMVVPSGATGSCFLKATVQCNTRAESPSSFEAAFEEKCTPEALREVSAQQLRLSVADCVHDIMQLLKLSPADRVGGKELPLEEARNRVQSVFETFQASPAKDMEEMEALKEDLVGQVSEAISRSEWYTKWGIHYLPSLMIAHLMQQCNNFKDAGVQYYGGDLFNAVRDTADDIFLQLPAPRPSQPPTPPPRPDTTAAAPAAPARALQSMAAYYNPHAGCFAGDCLVRMADGTERRAADVRKGDLLASPEGADAAPGEVLCTVLTRTDASGTVPLVSLGDGLRITPYHPVCLDNEWRFPLEVAPVEDAACNAICTFLLKEGGSSAVVGGTTCVTLGHGLDTGAARHAFYSSWQAVHADLARFPGFETGIVELSPGCVLRDPVTGQVCGLAPPSQ